MTVGDVHRICDRRKTYRDWTYLDVNFRNRYRFTKKNARRVIVLVRPNLYENKDSRGLSISENLQFTKGVLFSLSHLHKLGDARYVREIGMGSVVQNAM